MSEGQQQSPRLEGGGQSEVVGVSGQRPDNQRRSLISRLLRRGQAANSDPGDTLGVLARADTQTEVNASAAPANSVAESPTTTAINEVQQIRDEAAKLEEEAARALNQATTYKTVATEAKKEVDRLSTEIAALKAEEDVRIKEDEAELLKKEAYGKLSAAGIDFGNKTVDQVMAEMKAKGWTDDQTTRNFIAGGIEQAKLVQGEKAFGEISSFGIDVTATTEPEDLLKQLAREKGWKEDDATKEYVQKAVEHAKRIKNKGDREQKRATDKTQLRDAETKLPLAEKKATDANTEAGNSQRASEVAKQKAEEAGTKAGKQPVGASLTENAEGISADKEIAKAELAKQKEFINNLRKNPEGLKAAAEKLNITQDQLLEILNVADKGLDVRREEVDRGENNPLADSLLTVLFAFLAVTIGVISAVGIKER